MKNKQLRRRGIRVSQGQSALEAIKSSVPHWIHHTVEDASYINGIKYLRECSCSVCGYVVHSEKDVCPHCGAKMRMLDE